jgi:hypothetical protein
MRLGAQLPPQSRPQSIHLFVRERRGQTAEPHQPCDAWNLKHLKPITKRQVH